MNYVYVCNLLQINILHTGNGYTKLQTKIQQQFMNLLNDLLKDDLLFLFHKHFLFPFKSFFASY